ncbi:TMEM175 family protein, partial [Acinetobacter baumannii]
MAQHHHEDLFENRKQFQLERLILFSDAVFAIAITLLVIEIRVPEIDNKTNVLEHLKDELWLRFPQFFGFVLSFT